MTNKPKRKEALRFFPFFFIFLVLYSFLVVRRCAIPSLGAVAYLFHCVDFDFGFCSKFLPGALYGLFVSSPSPTSAAVYETVLLLLGFAAAAYYLSRFYADTPAEHKKTALILSALYLTGPCTFAPFSYQLGMLDVYWIYISLIYIAALKTKYAKWLLCPALLFVSTMIHNGVIITYIPFLCLLTLYEAAKEKDKKETAKKAVLLLLCIAVALSGFLYFLANDKKNVTVSMTEFDDTVTARGAEMTRYFDVSLFCNPEDYSEEFLENYYYNGEYPESPYTPVFDGADLSAPEKLVNALVYQVQYQYYTLKNSGIAKSVFTESAVLLVILSPLLILFYTYTVKKYRKEKTNRLLRFVYFCMLFMFPLAAFSSLLISTDSVRWIAHGFLCLFTLVLFMLHDAKEDLSIIGNYFSGFSPVIGIAYFFIYALTVLDPYV